VLGVVALLESLIVFVVSLLVGGLGIYAGSRVCTNTHSYERALVTALLGAVVWASAGFFVGWIPLFGPLLVLVAYLAVVNWQYPGGWATAAGIALVLDVVVSLLAGTIVLNVVKEELPSDREARFSAF
jgi:hypothetical protein